MKQKQFLKDYRPCAYLIDTVELTFDIGEPLTRVSARCQVRRREGEAADAPLRLDGRAMELVAIEIDGDAVAPSAYSVDDLGLTLQALPAEFELHTVVDIDPTTNTTLEGWYRTGDMISTQCESHGFSRITYFPDRPDVMSRYTTVLIADPERYPVLLSNGNCVDRQTRDDGRVAVTWEDPHPKPCYLFAAVAGDLARREGHFTTASGRQVSIEFYSDHGIEDRVDHAMDSLIRSMRWDEEAYGREYDLDIYMVVVAGAFNMGAMENKGLNIFNPRFVLASPETATDHDHAEVEACVAHEYFHNWSGNRVTCRDWFQLSLKEGLTVFREQQFSSDSGAGPVQRIAEVRSLRSRQFVEDGGPLAHPVRPECYVEMNNFYTATVYDKGAELVRVLHSRLGEHAFRKGMDLYFERHDGQAVTIEDFLKAHADASGLDTSPLLAWYQQSGTPVVKVSDRHDDAGYHLSMEQVHRPGAEGERKVPVPIPVVTSLLATDGCPQSLNEAGDTRVVLNLDEPRCTWTFELDEAPTPVLFQGLSAPVIWEYDYAPEQLQRIVLSADDPFARWDAAQRIYRTAIDAGYSDQGAAVLPVETLRVLAQSDADRGVLAELLTPSRCHEILSEYDGLDPQRLQQAVDGVEQAMATGLRDCWPGLFAQCSTGHPYAFAPADVAQRRWRARILELWVRSGDAAALDAAAGLYASADNLTDRMAALNAVNRSDAELREQLLDRFYQQYRNDKLVLDRWFALQAAVPVAGTRDVVERLLRHPDFVPTNPNRVRALLGTFGMLNPAASIDAQGAGQRLLGEQIVRFDSINPQLASRLVVPFANWRKLSGAWREASEAVLRDLASRVNSPDVSEQVQRILR